MCLQSRVLSQLSLSSVVVEGIRGFSRCPLVGFRDDSRWLVRTYQAFAILVEYMEV